MQESAYIISLKFAQGLKKEFVVLGENLRRYGFGVNYVISDLYSNLDFNCGGMSFIPTKDGIRGMLFDSIKYFSMKQLFDIINNAPPFFVLFYNPHPLNPRFCYLIKKNFPNAVLSLYLHDPYKPDKSYYGFKKGIYMKTAEFIQGITIKYMDYIISPSEYSSELFKKRFPNFKGKNYLAPLLVPDQRSNSDKGRKYFSMVGGAHLATGHDTFIEVVNYVAEKGLDFEFCLISSSNIKRFLGKLTEKGKKILKIINKPMIKDAEINEVVSESYAVFRLDKEVTQSGVIPVAFMSKTPVIARGIPGLIQHVKHGNNGYIVPFNCTPEDLIKATEYVKYNFTELSKNARKSYEDIWAEWNFDKYYEWLVELLKSR